jgi:osmoprotectant transport system permease protein
VAIWRGITTNFPALTFAGSILVALMAITADLLLGFVEKKIYKKIYGSPGGLIQ